MGADVWEKKPGSDLVERFKLKMSWRGKIVCVFLGRTVPACPFQQVALGGLPIFNTPKSVSETWGFPSKGLASDDGGAMQVGIEPPLWIGVLVLSRGSAPVLGL